jgi:predicted RNA-binding Zn-ribbon protein involved in translation (DUF1610 family)
MATENNYIEMSCPNCESQYALDFHLDNVSNEADYCPFCGEEIPEEDLDDDLDDDEENEAESW